MQKPIDNKYRGDFDIQIDSFEDIQLQTISDFPIISIYFNPKDYPGKYVARVFDIRPGEVRPTRYIVLSKNLAELRSAIPSGLSFMKKSPKDDPQLIEVWL